MLGRKRRFLPSVVSVGCSTVISESAAIAKPLPGMTAEVHAARTGPLGNHPGTDGSPARYEGRAGDNHHHHFVCRRCGPVADAGGSSYAGFRSPGFRKRKASAAIAPPANSATR